MNAFRRSVPGTTGGIGLVGGGSGEGGRGSGSAGGSGSGMGVGEGVVGMFTSFALTQEEFLPSESEKDTQWG